MLRYSASMLHDCEGTRVGRRRTRQERIEALRVELADLEKEQKREEEERRVRWAELLGPLLVTAVESGDETVIAVTHTLVDGLSSSQRRELLPLLPRPQLPSPDRAQADTRESMGIDSSSGATATGATQ